MSVDLTRQLRKISPLGQDIYSNSYDVGTLESMGAQLGYSYAPIIDAVKNYNTFGSMEMDMDYSPLQDMEGYEDHFDSLVYAKNQDHMSVLKDQIDKNQERREILSNSTFVQGLVGGLVDPINLVALPFGGPTVGLGKSLVRGALAAGTTQAGLEAIRYPVDPLATVGESAINIGATTVFGAMMGTAISVPLTRRAAALRKHMESHEEFLKEAGLSPDVQYLTADDLANKLKREDRSLGAIPDKDLESNINLLDKEASNIDARLNELDGKRKTKKVKAEIENLSEARAKTQKEIDNIRYERGLRSTEDSDIDFDNPYDLDPNIFINSPFFKFVTTPFKRVLQSKIDNIGKKAMVMLGNDSGLALVANRIGASLGKSVYQQAKVMEAEWVQYNRQMLKLWGDGIGQQPTMILGLNVTDVVQKGSKLKSKVTGNDTSRTYGDFLKEASYKRVHGIKGSNNLEKQTIKLMDDFYKGFEERLMEIGLLGSLKKLQDRNGTLKGRLIFLEAKKNPNLYEQKKIDSIKAEMAENEMSIESMSDQNFMPSNEDVFMPRYFNIAKITKDRENFEKILRNWFRENPYIYVREGGKYVKKDLSKNPEKIKDRAKEATDKILGIQDLADPESITYGYGKSKHLRHRELDIPNKLIYDYIVQDPLVVMKMYAHKTSGVYQFHKRFGAGISEVLDDLEMKMTQKGNTQDEINLFRRDFKGMYDRIVGSPITDISRIDNKMANWMKEAAYLNYLGASGFSAIPDFARIIMEHELGDVLKATTAILDQDSMTVKLTNIERDLIGEGIELEIGSSHLRTTEHLSNNPFSNSWWDSARNAYSIANLLGPMTAIAKRLDGIVRGHTLLEMAVRVSNGLASNQDTTYLARYGIDIQTAKRISKQPFEKGDKGLLLPNTTKWEDQDLAETFRTAMQSGILNTVMMGTPADRPLISDGVVYVKHSIAKVFGYEEDPIVKGFSKVESGLLGMPFQFMSYSFAAMNKVTGAYSQGQIKNRMAGVFAAIGLGYLSVQIKTPQFAWEEMSWSDRFTRAFDQSGLLSLYSDLMYTSIGTSMALGHGNYMDGLVSAKFPQQENTFDAITGVLGAGASITADLTINPAVDFINGDYGEGTKTFLRSLPFARLWFWKDEMNSFSLGLSRSF